MWEERWGKGKKGRRGQGRGGKGRSGRSQAGSRIGNQNYKRLGKAKVGQER